jgi:hypothetical protein
MDSQDFDVLVSMKCSKCHGSGEAPHPLRESYGSAGHGQSFSNYAQGLGLHAEDLDKVPAKIQCPQCQGDGRVACRYVSVEELVRCIKVREHPAIPAFQEALGELYTAMNCQIALWKQSASDSKARLQVVDHQISELDSAVEKLNRLSYKLLAQRPRRGGKRKAS